VTSDPSGASIFLNGATAGENTDAVLTGLEPGSYTVRVSLDGYVAAPESLFAEVVAGDTAEAAFTLAPLPRGSIAVLSSPAGASISLDGDATGLTTPDTLEELAAGAHVVRVSLEGYRPSPESLIVSVAADSVSVAEFSLAEVVRRLVLIEHFSNTSCDPCAATEQNLELVLGGLGHAVVVSAGNHVNFPAVNDPFYLADPAQLMQRARQFNVIAVPHMRIDGVRFDDSDDYDALLAAVQTASERDPYFEIGVSASVVGDSFVISGTVEKLAVTPEGDESILALIIETDIAYDAPNGLTHFDDITRRFLPATNGEALSVEIGEEHPYRFAEALSGSWNPENLEAIVFIESRSTRKVYQASSTR
jgi:hypothetical protein